MATENKRFMTTIQALEDLDSHQYIGFSLSDGKVANNAGECIGIICNKPKSGENASIAYFGESKFKAGGAISADADITVATSGYFTQADSNDTKVGVAKSAVTSGSVGTGFFNFATPVDRPSAFTYTVDNVDTVGQGYGYALIDNKLSNNDGECSGIAPIAIASGDQGQIVVSGVVTAVIADSYGIGMELMATTSGYFTTVVSGTLPQARMLTSADSGQQATVMFWGGGGHPEG